MNRTAIPTRIAQLHRDGQRFAHERMIRIERIFINVIRPRSWFEIRCASCWVKVAGIADGIVAVRGRGCIIVAAKRSTARDIVQGRVRAGLIHVDV